MADRHGARRILTAVVTFWSLFTGLTAFAGNFSAMLVVRLLFGAGEAGAFPGMARAVYLWIPVQERGLVKGINFSASRLGAALTMPLLPLMSGTLGWKESFLVLMGVGVLWAVTWWWWFRDEPPEAHVPAAELRFILGNRQEQGAIGLSIQPLPLCVMAASANLWLMMGQYFASNFTFFFCLSWLFPYVQKTYYLSFTQAGFYAMIPLLCGAAGNVCSGLFVDALFRTGRSVASRRLPAVIGFVLAAVGLAMSVGQAGGVGRCSGYRSRSSAQT